MWIFKFKKERHATFLTIWAVGCGLATFAMLVGYGLSQQAVRQLANEPQLTWVHDDIVDIGTFQADPTIPNLVPSQVINPRLQYAPFVEIIDANNQVVNSNVASSSNLPLPSAGVFAAAKNTGLDKVTWQLDDGTRIALVAGYDPKTGDYVISGRSLVNTEVLESHLGFLAILGWLLMLVLVSLTCLLGYRYATLRSLV